MKNLFKLVLITLLLYMPVYAETIVLPSVVYSPGANNSFWKTAIGVYNASDGYKQVEISTINGVGTKPIAILAPGQYGSTDNLAELFDVGYGTFIALINVSGPGVVLTARTYTTDLNTGAQYGTLLPSLTNIGDNVSLTFSKINGARKALFLYGPVYGDCILSNYSVTEPFYSFEEEFKRFDLPETTVECTVYRQKFPSGYLPDYTAYVWGSEADNISNCPTVVMTR